MAHAVQSLGQELRRARIYQVIYLLAGLGLLAIGVALLVMMITERDRPALFLAAGGFVFGVLMLNQARLTRRRKGELEAELEASSRSEAKPVPGCEAQGEDGT